jgi:hypothetical protein
MTAFGKAWGVVKGMEEDIRESSEAAQMKDFSHLPQINGPIRYYETRRGIAYEAPTEHGVIYNEGNGGGTYFDPSTEEGKAFVSISEWDWEDLITQHEEKQNAQLYGGE